MMAGFVDWIRRSRFRSAAPGLFIIAFLDSSFLSFPEVNDLLIIWLTTQHQERMVYYALMTTLGSVSGCLALYALARKGGKRFSSSGFKPAHVERAMTTFRRYGLLAILVPSILPPPTPFKIFVLAAGVAESPPGRVHSWRSPSAGGSAISAKACSRSITATQARRSSTEQRQRRSALVVALGGGRRQHRLDRSGNAGP